MPLYLLQLVTNVKPEEEHISEEGGPYTAAKPVGEVMLPAVICGVVGTVLTVILSVIGRYEGVDLGLKEYYMGEPFYMKESSGWHEGWNWLLVVLLTFGVSFAVLDTDRKWRRVMVILLASVVILMSSPVLMLWEVFWSPVMIYVGVLWSWICAFIYSCQHTMPCELFVPVRSEVKNEDIDMSPLVISERLPELVEHEEGAEEKYQPKENVSCPD